MDLSPTDSITLTLPAAPAAVRIARAGAAGLATRAGFTYQEVEQLQLAVGEAAALLALGGDPPAALTLTFDVLADGLRVELRRGGGGPAGTARPAPPVAAAVLDSAVDRWHIDDGGRRVVLRKRLSEIDEDDD